MQQSPVIPLARHHVTQSRHDEPQQPLAEEERRRHHRRMQVRRAQINHRQRKENHVKQLELDVCQLRDLIRLAELDTEALKRQNDGLRTVLRSSSARSGHGRNPGSISGAPPTQQPWPLPEPAPQAVLGSNIGERQGDFELDEMDVTFSVNEIMGTPCFQISPRSSLSSGNTSSSSPMTQESLAPEQELRVINFILALEHICWDHFWLGDFHFHTRESETPHGHALTASAYLMASAPESVYKERSALKSKPLSFWRRSKSSPSSLQWPAPAVSLESLHGLARSLNPGIKETTPVEAWFELAERYPVDFLLAHDVLDSLLREFSGVVDCIHFGAVIERQAFESIVTRILGPSTVGPPYG